MATTYRACDSCAIALTNGDTTHLDEDELDVFEAFIERVGPLTDAGAIRLGGYWDCEVCEATTLGTAEVFETID